MQTVIGKKTLNGKILTNCKSFVKFINIFPVKIFCRMVVKHLPPGDPRILDKHHMIIKSDI